MIDIDFKYENLIAYLKKEAAFNPEISIVLGSGLGDFAESVKIVKTIPTNDLPSYPPATITGHKGFIHFAEYEDKKLLLFQGRIHFYEGYPLSECILPAYISDSLKAGYFIATNAAGGVNTEFVPGDLMLTRSFIGLNLKKEISELIGIPDVVKKQNFLNFPSEQLNDIIRKAAFEENISIKEGIYWYNKGPVYETPAEIRMSKFFGADAVGMSTVPETYYAALKGLKTASISCITNYAAGILNQKLTHIEVTVTAKSVKEKLEKLIKRTISDLQPLTSDL
jgi:purine-nucleoside phosphorylase